MDYLLNEDWKKAEEIMNVVLNLIINGLPSKPKRSYLRRRNKKDLCFKPYYKWITF